MEGQPEKRGEPLCLRPIHATCWRDPSSEDDDPYTWVDKLGTKEGVEELRRTVQADKTVWIEAYLHGLVEETKEWFEGNYDVWDSMDNPEVAWEPMAQVLDAVGLQAPPAKRSRDEPIDRLLRAVPYVYTRGTFGTIRDALSEGEVAEQLGNEEPNDPLTAFPIVGFYPDAGNQNSGTPSYTAIRGVVAAGRHVVITVRLPNTPCVSGAENDWNPCSGAVTLDVPKRFLPLRRAPRAREVAEAIGIHQATTAREVANRIRDSLQTKEELARKLSPNGSQKPQKCDLHDTPECDLCDPQECNLRDTVVEAGEETSQMAEVAHRLDRQISQILRRFGDRFDEAPKAAKELVPYEAKRRYEFARDDVRQLHDDCRLASTVIADALSAFDHSQRERLQFIAALLASVVLVPALIASVFGVNLGVPGENSVIGFLAFVAAIAGLGVVGYSALHRAAEDNWSLSRVERTAHIACGVAILLFLIGILAIVS